MKQLNGLSKYVVLKSFSNREKLYIKGTRIPVNFLINTVKETGDINSFIRLYPWLKERKKDLLFMLTYFMENGAKETLYD